MSKIHILVARSTMGALRHGNQTHAETGPKVVVAIGTIFTFELPWVAIVNAKLQFVVAQDSVGSCIG